MISKNRKASFQYAFIEKFTAGMVLQGTEIKSIRAKDVSIDEGYCLIQDGELFIRNMHIGVYDQGTYNNHEPKRDRKLLLQRKEIKKLENKLKDQGLTIIPTALFISDSGYAKIDIALSKGKKIYDKREDLKQKALKREIDRDS